MTPPPASSGRPDPILRIARTLAARAKAEGGYSKLAAAITAADQKARGRDPVTRDVIDRRKLKRLVAQDPDEKLSIRQLIALDHYLEEFGQGLARLPIFVRPTLLATLAESPEITFLLGAKVEERPGASFHHSYYSRWDVTALREVQREMYSLATVVRTDFEDILLEGAKPLAEAAIRSAPEALLGDSGPSLVSLGSPRASHASEAMLAKMFGVEELERTTCEDSVPPFHFVRPRVADLGVPSAFALYGEEVVHLDEKLAQKVIDGKAWALRIGRKLLPAEDGRPQTPTYGVIAAQRRPGGQVWIVLAGLSAPGTLAAALGLAPLVAPLPEPSGARPANVLWVVMKARVEDDDRRPGLRRLVWHGPVGGPRYFKPLA